jgi:hypothetical protein
MTMVAAGAVALDQAPTISIHCGRLQGAVIHHRQELGTRSYSRRYRKASGAHLHRQPGEESLMVGRRVHATRILRECILPSMGLGPPRWQERPGIGRQGGA